MGVKSYQPDLVTVSFRGVPLTGFAEGVFVASDRNEDGWAITVGSGGAATRAKTGNKSGRVTVTLLGASESNEILTAFYLADEASGTGIGTLVVKDLSGGDTVFCETAWIVRPPAQEKSNEETNREWIFETDKLEIINNGIPLSA